MTALLVLLLAVSSALSGRGRAGWRLWGPRLTAGLLAVGSALAVLGVLVGRAVLHLRAGSVAVVVLVSVAWTCWDLVPQAWWTKVTGFWQQGRAESEGGLDRVVRGARLARAALMLLAAAICAVVSQPLGSRAAKAAAVVGVVIFLAAPANRIVSDILAVARQYPEKNEEPCNADAPMRGGRWIGPLERILILLLASAEAPAAVAAIVAAKGVIRFPEISKDEGGQKAEEFLIGSFASWILAILGAVAVHLA